MYIPGLPGLERDFGVTTSLAELTFSTCVMGFAIGQILSGPLSDALGRRGPLLWGMALYTLTSLLSAIAPTIWILIVVRLFQGVAASSGMVIARASTRDMFTGSTALRVYGKLMLIFGLAPILAPAVGGQIVGLSGWRAVFIALAAIGAALWFATWRSFGETLPTSRRRHGGLPEAGRSIMVLLRDSDFRHVLIANTMLIGTLMTYIGSAPFVFKSVYGYSPEHFSLVFSVNAVGMTAGTQMASRLAAPVGPGRLLAAGVGLAGISGAGLLVAALSGHPQLLVLIFLFGMVWAVGLIMPTAAVLSMAAHPDRAGAAAGVLGLLGTALGAIGAPIVGLLGSHSVVPMAAILSAFTFVAVASLLARAGTQRHRRATNTELYSQVIGEA